MKIAITGSNGFIGSALKDACFQRRIEYIGLCRNPIIKSELLFDLNNPGTFKNIPDDINALVHTAYTTQAKDLKYAYKSNIEGSAKAFTLSNLISSNIFIKGCVPGNFHDHFNKNNVRSFSELNFTLNGTMLYIHESSAAISSAGHTKG